MTASRDPDQLIHHFLLEGEERLHDQVYDAVRADIEQQRQRVVIGPWRMPDMNKLVPFGLGAAAVVAVLAIGSQLLGPVATGGVGAAPTAQPTATPISGSVSYQLDGGTATTKSTPSPMARVCPARPSRRSSAAPTPSSWRVPTETATHGPSPARSSRPRSQARRPATGRWSSSGTARPSTSRSGSPPTQRSLVTVTLSHRATSPLSASRTSARGVRGAGAPA